MKLKLLTVILILAALFSGVVLWRVDRFVYGDRLAWAEAQGRSQMSSMTQALNAEIQSARRLLNSLGPETFRKDRTNWNSLQPYYALALMTTQPGGGMSITQMVSKDGSPAAGWSVAELTKNIGFIGKELEKRSAVILRAFRDSKKNRHVAVIFAGNGRAYILIGTGANFQSLIESQRGSMNSFMIVAADGLTIAHSTREYVGTVMGDSAIMKEIRNTGAAQGLGTYEQGRKKVFGMYEQVPGTNSYLVSTLPMEDLLKGRLSLTWQFVFLALGFALVGAALYFWFERQASLAEFARNTLTMDELASRTAAAAAAVSPGGSAIAAAKPTPSAATAKPATTMPKRHPAPEKPPTPPPGMSSKSNAVPSGVLKAPSMAVDMPSAEPSPELLQQEKSEAYRQVAAAMGQEMRAPIASILGFSQMVLAKTQDPDVVQAVDSILREARSSRDVLEKLSAFAGEHKHAKVEAKIEGPLIQALKNLESKLQQKGVKVEKDFQTTSPWMIAPSALTTAFENIFINSIEAMERMPEKQLQVSLWEDPAGLHLRVADSGEGIDLENLEKVFDPFFTTRSFAQHVGLGLPVVVGILKEHHGQVKIHSQRGKGTTVDMTFLKQEEPAKVAPSSAPSAVEDLRPQELPVNLLKVEKPSPEEIQAHQESLPLKQEVKLTDVNVDTLLDMGPDEPPLQFLDGQGFEEPPRPPPRVLAPPIAATVIRPGGAPVEAKPEAPPSSMPAMPPPPPSMEVNEDTMTREASSEAAPPPFTGDHSSPSITIDTPTRPALEKTSALDSFKVEIRRPGKRT